MRPLLTFISLSIVLLLSLNINASSLNRWQFSETHYPKFELILSKEIDAYASLSLEKNTNILFEEQMNNPHFLFACLDVESHLPAMVFTDTMEGIGLEQTYVLAQKKGWQLFEIPNVIEPSSVESIDVCKTDVNSHWQLNDISITCACDFSDVHKQVRIDQQWADLTEGMTKGLSDQSGSYLSFEAVHDSEKLEKLLTEARTHKDIKFERTVDGNQWIIVERENGVYHSLSLGLVKTKQQWSIWYYATGNSKAFHAIEDIYQTGQTTLNMTLCRDDCDWWGKQAQLEVDLKTLKYQLIDIE